MLALAVDLLPDVLRDVAEHLREELVPRLKAEGASTFVGAAPVIGDKVVDDEPRHLEHNRL